jgi:hypothetical protein
MELGTGGVGGRGGVGLPHEVINSGLQKLRERERERVKLIEVFSYICFNYKVL